MAKKLLPFYNVDQSVGKGGTNQLDDVLLVQHMLSRVGTKPPHPLPAPAVPLAVDGMASPLLTEWILWFQKCVKAKGQHVIVDGRIDPTRAHTGTMYPPDHGFSMYYLNTTFRRRFPQAHDALDRDPSFPAALRAKFAAENEPYE